MDRHEIRRNVGNFGIVKALQDLALRALNRVLPVKILKGVTISKPDPNFAMAGENYRHLFLDRSMLMKFAADPCNELSEDFVRDAVSRGDECYGFLEGDALASYGWYSRTPTAIDPKELILHFDRRYVYMYKGFTHVTHRGQRLHAIGMTRALETYLAQGYAGIVSYVEWNNFASLRSCYRMGYKDFGTLILARVFGRYITHSSRGCKPYGFRLERARPLRKRAKVGRNAGAAANS